MKKFDCKILSGLQKFRRAEWWKVMGIVLFLITNGITQILALESYTQATKLSLKVENQPVAKIMDNISEGSIFASKVEDKQIDLNNRDATFNIGQVSQQRTVSGKVTDSGGQPLPGVTVVVKGTTQGTVTNANGEYSLTNIPQDATLVFSFVGMRTQEVVVGSQTTISMTMEEETIGLEEVVAVGYGTMRKINLTGSVATVSSKELTVAPVASTTNALTGRLPGLITKQESGLPGADAATLSIRGFGAPLVIVDGVESSFNNIDANEIESISVLKDASAAIYGSRAGNGVILVTTKRGTLSKPVINLQSNYITQGITYFPKLVSSGQQAELMLESHFNQGLPESTAPWTQEEVDLFYAGTNPDYPNTDWFKLAANEWAPQYQHHLSVRGGSDKIKYYGLIGYLDQLSFFKNNGGEYQRYNIRSNIDAKITDKLSIQFDFSTIIEDRDYPFRAMEQQSSVWQEYWSTQPWYLGELPDKTKIAYGGIGGAVSLPVVTNSEISGYRKTDSQNIKGTFAATYNFNVKGLSAKAFINYDQNYNNSKSWDWLVDSWTYNYSNDTYTQATVANNRGLTYNVGKNRMLTGQISLNFDRTFVGDHHVTALALYEIIDYNSMGIYAFRDGQKTFSLDYAFAGSLANQKVNDGASEMGRTSYIGRLNYDFKSKYLLESTLRVDKSAKFSPDERVGVFPSISLGWRISEENFMKESAPALENLKLRTSFSKTGNDAVGNFQYLAGYRYGEIYLIGSNATAGLVATGLANPLLTWEEMTIYNVGLDFGFKKRILYGELDFFYRERDGIPGKRVRSLPDTFGADLPTENLNNINTRGFELKVGNEGSLKDFRWDISANISWARSKWGFYDEPEYDDLDEERLYKRTGKWTDIDYGYVSEGLFTSQEEIDALTYVYDETQGNASIKPGDIRYKDINNDGLLNWRDQVEIGNGTMPHWMLGINLNLNYKNFDMQALFQGALGFTQKINLQPGNMYSTLVYNERWTPENNNRDGLVPRLGGAASNRWNSDFNYKKSDYLRLKTFSLGYNLPKLLGIENLRLYIAGTNLFTISELNKYSIDPEGRSGWTGYYYPQMRTITLGLNLSL